MSRAEEGIRQPDSGAGGRCTRHFHQRRWRAGPVQTVGLVDAPGNLFVFSLFEAGEIWTLDMSNDTAEITRFQAGKSPYDALITPDGRYHRRPVR